MKTDDSFELCFGGDDQTTDSVVRSFYYSQDVILKSIIKLHCPSGFDADLTYGNGSFWRKINKPKLCFDATPLQEHVKQADSRSLPVETASLNSVVFDPPFLTYVKNGRAHNGKVRITSRFGGYYLYDELEQHYRGTLAECYRVLAKGGVMVFKCQDIIHNHRMHCTHANVIEWAKACGFRLLDLFVLPAKHRMPGPQKGTQRHARVFHSYFLVLKRDNITFSR